MFIIGIMDDEKNVLFFYQFVCLATKVDLVEFVGDALVKAIRKNLEGAFLMTEDLQFSFQLL